MTFRSPIPGSAIVVLMVRSGVKVRDEALTTEMTVVRVWYPPLVRVPVPSKLTLASLITEATTESAPLPSRVKLVDTISSPAAERVLDPVILTGEEMVWN